MTGVLHNQGETGTLWRAVGEAIGRQTGSKETLVPLGPVSGGDINQAVHVRHGTTPYFVKLNRAGRLGMFEAEAAGLTEIAETESVRCPLPIATGHEGARAFLVLEYLDLGGRAHSSDLGERLAALHRTQAARFGWRMDNTLGTTPQPNDWKDAWVPFLRQHRLGHQLELAARNGLAGRAYERGQELLGNLDAFFSSHSPVPSLLHGDLWGGNYGFLASGEPVVFDPAVYFGDRESDLAMTELFGGFSADFYAAYRSSWPLDAGYRVRKTLYQLYHVLNHFNLFGGGYGSRAQHMIDQLLAEVR